MDKCFIAEAVAWKVLSLDVERAQEIIENQGFEMKVVEAFESMAQEPFIFLDIIYVIVNNSKIVKARLG